MHDLPQAYMWCAEMCMDASTLPLQNGPKVDLGVCSQDARKCYPLVAHRIRQALREPASHTARQREMNVMLMACWKPLSDWYVGGCPVDLQNHVIICYYFYLSIKAIKAGQHRQHTLVLL